MNIKDIALISLISSLALTGCGTMPSTEGESTSTSGGSSGAVIMGGGTTSDRSGSDSSDSDASTSGEATTSEERSGTLSKTLDDSLGEFDKTLEEEQQRTAAERDARASNRTATASTQESEGGIGRREGDLRSERAGQSGSGGAQETGDNREDRGVIAGGSSGAPDRSIPSGEDDDIVARRLRRAAEQETDPELKEKLWKEYMEYKRNVQGRG
jgi:hypothetical protein